MIRSILSLARKDIRQLKPYSSARSLVQEASVFLDANELPWSPFPEDLPLSACMPSPQRSKALR